MFYSPAFIFSSDYSLGFGFLAGLRLLVLRQFSAFLKNNGGQSRINFVVVDAGATCIIQPGGSMRDQEVIDAANERGVAMVFTGVRHFRH